MCLTCCLLLCLPSPDDRSLLRSVVVSNIILPLLLLSSSRWDSSQTLLENVAGLEGGWRKSLCTLGLIHFWIRSFLARQRNLRVSIPSKRLSRRSSPLLTTADMFGFRRVSDLLKNIHNGGQLIFIPFTGNRQVSFFRWKKDLRSIPPRLRRLMNRVRQRGYTPPPPPNDQLRFEAAKSVGKYVTFPLKIVQKMDIATTAGGWSQETPRVFFNFGDVAMHRSLKIFNNKNSIPTK